ncbi:MAG: hypothetical protein L6Q84_33570 [Polyangiaceae bacterium]|nr:hypothetical protein [Polyangiaceae bacterium]
MWGGPGSAPPPSCGAAYPTLTVDGMQGLLASPASCGACGCGSPIGMVCALATVQFFQQAGCSGTPGQLTIAANVCQAFVILGYDPVSAKLATAPPAGGACNPLPTQDVVPPLAWNARARACGGAKPGAACGGGVCTPAPESPFGGLCVARAGDEACPAGYPKKLSFFQGANDTRGCTDCSCGSPQGAACPGSVELWTNSQCSVDSVTIGQVGACASLPPDPSPPPPPYQTSRSMFYDGQPPVGGSCGASGGQVTGSATPTAPVTLCCL